MPSAPTNAIKTIGAQLLGRAGLWCLKARYPKPEAADPVVKLRKEHSSGHPVLPVSKALERFPWQDCITPPAFRGRGSGVCGMCVAAFHTAGLKFL